MKFKVGDKVKAIAKCDGIDLIGKTGTVVSIKKENNFIPIGVAFDDFIDGHNLDGKCKDGYGRWCEEGSLKLLTDEVKFKVGDRVIVNNRDAYHTGLTGTVRAVTADNVAVEFDKKIRAGHTAGGLCKEGCGWFFYNTTPLDLLDKTETPISETPVNEQGKSTTLDLPPAFAYVARDKDGCLFAYVDKPKRDVGGTQWYGEQFKKINNDLLPELKWTDEPYEVIR